MVAILGGAATNVFEETYINERELRDKLIFHTWKSEQYYRGDLDCEKTYDFNSEDSVVISNGVVSKAVWRVYRPSNDDLLVLEIRTSDSVVKYCAMKSGDKIALYLQTEGYTSKEYIVILYPIRS